MSESRVLPLLLAVCARDGSKAFGCEYLHASVVLESCGCWSDGGTGTGGYCVSSGTEEYLGWAPLVGDGKYDWLPGTERLVEAY